MFSRIKKAAKVVGRAVSSVARQGASLVKEAVNRVIGIPVFLLSWVGIQWPMKMRLRVVVLRDANNELVADPDKVMPSIEEAQDIFNEEANVRIQPFDNEFIFPAPSSAPPEALSVRCGFGLVVDELGKAGRYFKRYTARSASSFFTGYATPLTIFIVEDIKGKSGCAIGPSVRYAVVSVKGLESTANPCGSASEDPTPSPPDEEDDDDPPIIIKGSGGSIRSQLIEKVDDMTSTLGHTDDNKAHRILAHEIGHMCGLSPEFGPGRLDRHSKNCKDLMHTPPGKRLTKQRKAAIIRNSRFVSTL